MPLKNTLKNIFFTLLLMCLGVSSSALQALSIEDFVQLPDVEQVELAPSGNKLAMLKRIVHNDKRVLVIEITDLLTGKKTYPVVRHKNEFDVFKMIWANDRHILLKIDFFKRLYRENTGWNPKITERRLMVLDIEKSTLRNIITKKMFKRFEKKGWQPQFQDKIVDLLPSEPNYILHSLATSDPLSPRVSKVNLNTLERKTVQGKQNDWRTWISDRQGNVRVGIYRKLITKSSPLEKNRTEYRINVKDIDSEEWREAWRYNYGDKDSIRPLGFFNDPNFLLVQANNRGRKAIFKVDIRNPEKMELYYGSTKNNAGGKLFYSELTNEPVGYHTVSGIHFWDEKYKAFDKKIDKALPKTTNYLKGLSSDESKYLIYAKSDIDSGSFYLGDKIKKTLEPIAYRYANLDPSLLSESKSIRVTARDDQEVKIFLTRPNKSTTTPSPTIIYSNHGYGNAAKGGFDYKTQLLVNRGYTVIQVNFRKGTGGYHRFMEGGVELWGDQLHEDILDVLSWSIKEGISDPKKVCLFGEGYAGYAALMAAAKGTEKFQCVATIGAMTDLFTQVASAEGFTNYEKVKTRLSSKKEVQKKYSPTHYAKNFQASTLLIHGEDDDGIRAKQSEKMYRALKQAGKQVEHIEIRNEPSTFSSDESRIKVFKKIEEFFSKHLN